MKTLLEIEIEKVEKYLYEFTKTKAYDSGVRDVEAEYYLKGLIRAKRLVNKQIKLESLAQKEKE